MLLLLILEKFCTKKWIYKALYQTLQELTVKQNIFKVFNKTREKAEIKNNIVTKIIHTDKLAKSHIKLYTGSNFEFKKR